MYISYKFRINLMSENKYKDFKLLITTILKLHKSNLKIALTLKTQFEFFLMTYFGIFSNTP
jgi:hypothetical protein